MSVVGVRHRCFFRYAYSSKSNCKRCFSTLYTSSPVTHSSPHLYRSTPLHHCSLSTMLQSEINLIRGWPSPDLLPTHLLSSSAQSILSNPSVFVPALQYGADAGFQPLREELATWLHGHYIRRREPEHRLHSAELHRPQRHAGCLACCSDVSSRFCRF